MGSGGADFLDPTCCAVEARGQAQAPVVLGECFFAVPRCFGEDSALRCEVEDWRG